MWKGMKKPNTKISLKEMNCENDKSKEELKL